MIKSILTITLLFYYTAGTLFLPAGNFHTMLDIPEMYDHCKQTEHGDMNPFEFFTDHLMNLDGMFDSHNDADEQKSHTPFSFQSVQDFSFLPTVEFIPCFSNYLKSNSTRYFYTNGFYQSAYLPSIFRPPIY